MSSASGEFASAGPTPRKRVPRRAVYRSRVDNGGSEDALVVGEDARDALPRDLIPPRETESTGLSSQSAEDRWLKENVPPHW